VTYWVFSGLYGRGFAGEAAVPVGGEDMDSEKTEMAIDSSYTVHFTVKVKKTESERFRVVPAIFL
jgi:hypothetical protein